MTFIGNLLHNIGLRPRKAHSPKEASWSHDTFRALFPGAQWLGDGTDITIRWGEEDFHFNLEIILDVANNALVGAAISDFEANRSCCGLTTTPSQPRKKQHWR